MSTLLAIAQKVAGSIGVVKPASLIGNVDPTAMHLLSGAEECAEDLARRHNWSILQKEETITTVNGTANYAVPSDFLRLIPGTLWDRTQLWRMRGGLTPAQWQMQKGALAATAGLRRNVRLLQGPLAGSVLIDPTPTGVATVVYEYVSKHWCESSGGTGQDAWTADTDLFRIDDYLLRLGLRWIAKRELGLAYSDDRDDYDVAVRRAIKADLAMPAIVKLSAEKVDRYPNVPEQGFGV